MADALSRWAYPASQGLADVSKHGSLEATMDAHAIIEHEKWEEKESAYVQGMRERQAPRMLDLFSGTGSVGEVFRKRGYKVTSLDSDPRRKAKICEDKLAWDYKQFPPGHPEVITAGVPST